MYGAMADVARFGNGFEMSVWECRVEVKSAQPRKEFGMSFLASMSTGNRR